MTKQCTFLPRPTGFHRLEWGKSGADRQYVEVPTFKTKLGACVATLCMLIFSGQRDLNAQILHENIPKPAARSSRIPGSTPAAKQNPPGIVAQEKLIPKPNATVKLPSEIAHGTKDFAADRNTEWRPDYSTGADGTLRYVAVFDPSIMPFKRMTVLDRVNDDYSLSASSTEILPISVGGSPRGDEDLFWGSIVTYLPANKKIPFPSLSPGMRILSYETTPELDVQFAKDKADSFYVYTTESHKPVEFRLVFLAAARKEYFSSSKISSELKTEELSQLARESGISVPLLPSDIQRSAKLAARRLKVSGKRKLSVTLSTLVKYFREFSSKPAPENTSNPYLDLLLNQAGVCRHRAYTFVITAQSLGIPARYAANEAHAFVEVWLPSGWARIDLGGAALELEVDNAAQKTMYQASQEDPFPKPKEYRENYTQTSENVAGLSSEQRKESSENRRDDAPADFPGGDMSSSSQSQDPTPTAPPRATRSLSDVPPQELKGRAPLIISLAQVSTSVYRSGNLEISGKVSNVEKKGVSGLRVDIWIAPADSLGANSRLLGHTVSGDDGWFSSKVRLPTNVPLKKFDVFVSTPGNATYRPGSSS